MASALFWRFKEIMPLFSALTSAKTKLFWVQFCEVPRIYRISKWAK